MQLILSVRFIMFLWLSLFLAGVAFTGIGVTLKNDGDDEWKQKFILGVTMLIIAIAAFIVGIRTNFLHIEIINY